MTDGTIAGPSKPSAPKQKLGGYDFYRSIGSPKYVVAPMVDQSELAWRMLSRSPLPPSLAGPPSEPTPEVPFQRHVGGATLVYTPMIHAKVFSSSKQVSKGGDGQFDLSHEEEGSLHEIGELGITDRPLFVQFCANDPETLLAAAKKVEHRCDAVDINFGCPQGIAKRGNYGSFLQDDWELIKRLVGILHENLSIPVTAKFRVFPDKERTVAYAKMFEAAGAQIITCHGRTREMKGQMTGLADWEMIRAVKEAVSIPVFANGNILYKEDVERCMELTGCDGVMSAEGNLSNPALFMPEDHPLSHPPLTLLARRYLDIVEGLKTATANSAIRAHLFRLLKPELDRDESLRGRIAAAKVPPSGRMDEFRAVLQAIDEKVKPEQEALGPDWRPPSINPTTGYRALPSWVAQPYIRPSPASTEVGRNEDFASAAATPSGSRPASPAPATNMASPCASSSPTPCPSVAALRCPTRACLTHCRQIRAVAQGMDPDEAAKKASSGHLEGYGCEAHEEKFAAKRMRMQEKKKAQTEARRNKRVKNIEHKAAERAARARKEARVGGTEARMDVDDEEAQFGIGA